MTIDIVNLLEPNEIEEEDSVAGALCGKRGDGGIHRFVKLPPVRKTG
jgi:hypothetical protein